MVAEQFLMAKEDAELLGFGRIRSHKDCDEFCTLGVIKNNRNKGVGEELIKAIIKKSTQPLYLACIIPAYFEPFGFKTVNEYPAEMLDKLNYCRSELAVEEEYVIMQYHYN